MSVARAWWRFVGYLLCAATAQATAPCHKKEWQGWEQNAGKKQFPDDTPDWTERKDDDDNVTCLTPSRTPPKEGTSIPEGFFSLHEPGPYYRTKASFPSEGKKAFTMSIDYRTLDTAPVPPNGPKKDKGTEFELRTPNNSYVGNSGVYIFEATADGKSVSGLYEVQIIDPSRFIEDAAAPDKIVKDQKKRGGELLPNCNRNQLLPGCVYGVDPPGTKNVRDENDPAFTNRGKAKSEWNTLYIAFCPPKPKEGNPAEADEPAKMLTKLNDSVVFNGEIRDRKGPLRGTGAGAKSPTFVTAGPVFLQSHWGSRVEFRKPSITDLDQCPVK